MYSQKLVRIVQMIAILGLTLLAGRIDLTTGQATEPPPRQPGTVPIVPNLIFDAEPGPDVDTLQVITAGADTDEDAVARVVSYYQANQNRLQGLWREDNPQRLAAIFAMYVAHISQPYGETPNPPADLLEFTQQQRGHCGTYTVAQREINTALGLTWRELGDEGWHAWIEVQIDGNWEIFDSTVNVWIDQPVETLVLGGPRQYRMFYTPMTDINRPDARLHLQEGTYGYNMPNLRERVIGYGIYWWPHGEVGLVATNETTAQPG